jgi:alpha-amylase
MLRLKMFRFLLVLSICFSVFSLASMQSEDADEASSGERWNDRVFYEIFVRSFYDSDGDGIGDLQGVIEKLDYLNDGDPDTTDDLGVTGIWLMPMMPSPSYHGYDVTDYYEINPDYGTLEDFQRLIEAAHERGIAVIIDLVLNHTSSRHPWFLESQEAGSEYDDWYVWETENPNYRGPDGQQVWYPKNDRYYYALFWSEMPDLNYNNPDVTEQMYGVSRFWLEDMGVDGFRLDAIKYITAEGQAQENTAATHQWLQDYHDYVKSINPDALLVGEAWTSTNLIAPYVPDEVDIAFEFDLAATLLRSASFGLPRILTSVVDTVVSTYPDGQYATFVTNHDQNRIMTQVRGDVDAARLAAYIYLTMPGVPFIYYGEEIGMTGQKPDELIRTPMQWDDTPETAGFTTGTPWQEVNTDLTTTNVTAEQAAADSLWNVYDSLIDVRSDNSALRTGELTMVESNSRKVLSYLRANDEQTLLVIINMDDRAVTDYALTVSESTLTSDVSVEVILGEAGAEAEALSAEESGGFEAYLPFDELAPFSIAILELN